MSQDKFLTDSKIIELVERLRFSAESLPDPNEVSEFDEENLPEELKPFADVELFLNGEAKKIAVITGIETSALPTPEKLTDVQSSFLLKEYEGL